jgi:hypothetical protein
MNMALDGGTICPMSGEISNLFLIIVPKGSSGVFWSSVGF